ncbi:MAG: dephospho-CoA kinase [Nitrospira sp.]|nr:dephospho-CoA kinase [Nitrospira sp.]MDR4463890.1 dephospho-CoA kinase [Nitrospira sp.]MDR4468077.1 dephospho-CoA kinase [Nitrospira sp.]
MTVIGLTGGVATGKSTVAKLFKLCGAIVIDADALARDMVQPEKPAWREIVARFGKSVLNPDRTINRHALGAIVFRHPTKRRTLERIIHPRVAREQKRLTREGRRKNPNAVVIYDVPLLFEAGIDKRVDKTIVVTTDQETQIARLKKRNGLTRADALRRIKSQMALAKKRRLADYVLEGTTELRSLAKSVRQLYKSFRSL